MLGKGLSVYLDLLRVVAALLVVLCHLGESLTDGFSMFAAFAPWGHEAVIIFFVLSGFVIHHAASTSDTTFERFATSRITRIYSVVVPCILLTWLCDHVGTRLSPGFYQFAEIDQAQGAPVARVVWSILMLNESWLRLRMFSNLPYWSVCYEFWYYFLFAAGFYFKGIARVLLLGLFALIAGPRILLLFPVWLIGAAAYSERWSVKWRDVVVWLAFLQPAVVLYLYVAFDLRALSTAHSLAAVELFGGYKLASSNSAASDYLLGVSFTLNLMAAKRLDFVFVRWLPFVPLIRLLAARSFTLYLLHYPLLHLLIAAALPFGVTKHCGWLVAVATIGLPLLIAAPIENQRHRLRPLVGRMLQHLRPARPTRRCSSAGVSLSP
jgi:peptidoglycan/LPS O-acetylase OafA/YrhL